MEFSFGIQLDRLGVETMLLFENASGQRLSSIGLMDWHGCLDDDRPFVDSLSYEMNGTARYFHAIVQSLLLNIQTGKRR